MLLQASADGRAHGPAVAPPIVHDVLRGGGSPLDCGVRARMEPRFAHSFADVRVHADGRAAESARAVGAHAYAVGPHLVFGAGRYAPGSADGERLIAHELAHVVQGRGAASAIQPKLEIGAADDPAEREAERAAGGVEAAGARPAGGPAVMRLQRTEPTRAQIREDERLRGMGRWPRVAHQRWRRLSDAQRTLVLFHMSANYGPEFARAFYQAATTRRGAFRPRISATNVPTSTPAALHARGYRLAAVTSGLQYWVLPSGDELHILPRRAAAAVEPAEEAPPPPEPVPAEEEAGPPARVPDRSTFGPEVRRGTRGTSVIPGGRTTIQYEDGTLEVQTAEGVMTFRPRAGSTGAYDVYGADGALSPGVIWTIDLDEVFGTPAAP